MKICKRLLYIILFIVVSYNIVLIYVDRNIDRKLNIINRYIYHDCHKIWSSRGIYNTKDEQNSIKSFTNAAKAGYIGFEVDIYYDKNMNKFVISHSKPKRAKDGKLIYHLKDGKILTLEELFKNFSNKYYFWLDYKNLDRLDDDTTISSIKRLKIIAKKFDLINNLYIEGSNPLKLKYYSNSGFKTLMGFYPLPKTNIFGSFLANIYRIIYYFSDVTALSVQYGKQNNPKYSEVVQKNLKDIPQFLFHVPADKKLVKSLYKKKDIKVMLVGRDQSVNFASLNCL